MSDDQLDIYLNIQPDPQLAQKINQTTGALRQGLGQVNQGRPMLELEADAKRAAAAMQKAGKSAPATGGGAGGFKAAGALGVAGAGVGQLAGIAGLSGQAGSAIGLLGSSIGSLGPIGAGVAVGMVALGVVFKELNKVSESLRRETELLLAARYAEIDAAGKTTDEITRQLEAQVDAAEKAAQKAQVAADEETRLRDEQRSGLLGGLKDVGDAIGIWSDGVNEAQESAEEWGDKAADAKAQVEGLTDALDSTETAAADAAKALEKAAEAHEDAVLDEVDALGKRMKAEQDAQGRTKEANRERLKAIRDEQKILQAQVDALKASGLTGDEATAKLKGLTEQLKLLGSESQTVQKVMRQGTQADKEAAAERARERAAERSEQIRAQREAARERREARQEEERERLKEAIDFANKVAEIQYNGAKQAYDIQVNANRDMDRLRRQAAHESSQDFYQDYLGMFQRANDLAFQLNEARISADQGLTDASTNTFLNQQELRAKTPGAQQLLGGPTNYVTINAGTDLNAVTQHLQSMGFVAN